MTTHVLHRALKSALPYVAGCVDGRAGDHILLAPPYIVTPAEIEEIVSRLGEAVDVVLASVT
jgi:adenosylmethionine-8-amino-7-oxononanoate aminotransferase